MNVRLGLKPYVDQPICAIPREVGAVMRILGLDPGTIRLGWGVIETASDGLVPIGAGTLSVSARWPIQRRLKALLLGLRQVVADYRPDSIAYEDGFIGRYPRAGQALAHAQALVMVADDDLVPDSYSPTQVKKAVGCAGKSKRDSKPAVMEAVRLILGMEELPGSDEADALAVAICHANELRVKSLVDMET